MDVQILNLPQTKRCSKCKEYKELSCFFKNRQSPNGLRYDCKDCCNVNRPSYYAKNKEKVRGRLYAWRKENAEDYKKYNNEWREKNKEKVNAQQKARRAKDRKKYCERAKLHYAKNRDKIRERIKKNSDEANHDKIKHAKLMLASIGGRCKKRGIEFSLQVSDIIIPDYCPVLGVKMVRGIGMDSYSVDRIDNNKGYTKDNIIIVCRLVNMIKTCATPDQILAVGNFYKRIEELKS